MVEKKDVGDFTTIVLTAETADALIEWLNGNGFEFKTEDRENFEYYVEKGGYYFVAMKVNMDRADVRRRWDDKRKSPADRVRL